jgi:hypothetical protein
MFEQSLEGGVEMLRKVSAIGALGLLMSVPLAAPASAQRTVECANELGYCAVPYPTTVYYGYRNIVTSRFVRGGGIPCNNNVFGDPAPGLGKTCRFVVRGGYAPPPPRYERRRYYADPPPPPPRPYYGPRYYY